MKNREVKAQECHLVKAAEKHSEINKKSGHFTYFKEKILPQMYIIQLRNEANLTAQEQGTCKNLYKMTSNETRQKQS